MNTDRANGNQTPTPFEELKVVCNVCEAETILLIVKWGNRLKALVAGFCPRCGSDNVYALDPSASDYRRVSLQAQLPKPSWQVIGECPLPIGLVIDWKDAAPDRMTARRLEAQAYRALAAALEADPELPCRLYVESFRPTGLRSYRAVIRADEADEFELAGAARAALEAAGRTLDG
jgi:hypothetical protein